MSRGTDSSSLWLDLGSEGLRYDLSVPHKKGIGREFVRIVRSFCRPDNIRVIAVDVSLQHRERGARFGKLGNERLKERPDRVRAF
jgi:hypothetical protein